MSSTLRSEDLALLLLAVDLLDRHTSDELAKARQQNNNTKQAAMLNMRSRLIIVRAKLRTMQVSP